MFVALMIRGSRSTAPPPRADDRRSPPSPPASCCGHSGRARSRPPRSWHPRPSRHPVSGCSSRRMRASPASSSSTRRSAAPAGPPPPGPTRRSSGAPASPSRPSSCSRPWSPCTRTAGLGLLVAVLYPLIDVVLALVIVGQWARGRRPSTWRTASLAIGFALFALADTSLMVSLGSTAYSFTHADGRAVGTRLHPHRRRRLHAPHGRWRRGPRAGPRLGRDRRPRARRSPCSPSGRTACWASRSPSPHRSS